MNLEKDEEVSAAKKAAKKAYDAERYLRKKEKLLAQHREWRGNNQDSIKAHRDRWRIENRDRVAATVKAWSASNKEKRRKDAQRWREENRERVREINRNWVERNPLKRAVIVQNRRLSKLGMTPIPIDVKETLEKRQRGKCAGCGSRFTGVPHLDHIKPIARGGRHEQRNLQLLCAPCNLSKGARDPIDFMRQRGLLL